MSDCPAQGKTERSETRVIILFVSSKLKTNVETLQTGPAKTGAMVAHFLLFVSSRRHGDSQCDVSSSKLEGSRVLSIRLFYHVRLES